MIDDILVVAAFSWKLKQENAAQVVYCLHIAGTPPYLPLPTWMNLAPQYPFHTLAFWLPPLSDISLLISSFKPNILHNVDA